MPPTDPTGPWPEQQVLLTRLAAWMSERRWFPLKDEQPPDGAALRVVGVVRFVSRTMTEPRSGLRMLKRSWSENTRGSGAPEAPEPVCAPGAAAAPPV